MIKNTKSYTKLNYFGLIGVAYYYVLSLPIIRNILFGEGAKILEIYDGELDNEVAGAFEVFTQFALYFPYLIYNKIFIYFDIGGINVLVMLIMSIIIYRYFSHSKNFTEFILLAFLLLPAPLLFLSSFNKEIILVLSLFFAYGYNKRLRYWNKGYVFFIYAFLMRGYLMFVPLLMGIRKIGYFIIASLTLFIIGMSIEPVSEILFRLFNRRLAEKGYIANSEIIQTITVDGYSSLLYMLYEVIPQIFFPIFYSLSLKSIFFQLYIMTLLYICLLYRNNYSNIIIGLMIFYIVLDPDLGAYFRHLTSFFIFFPLLLNMGKRYGKA